MKISNKDFPLLFVLTFFMSIQKISNATDTITTTQILRDGETMVSSDGSFELGFFSPENSKNRYVGMWYKKITVSTVVWVANREVPLTNTSGVLKVVDPGLLVLLNDTNGGIIWSSNTSRHVKTPVAKLLDSGNLVVKDANDDDPGNFLWESFNYLTDTLLSGMKLGWNYKTGLEVYLSSWKNKDDPSSGDFTYHFDPTGYPQIVVKRGSVVQYKSGPWNGLHFSGTPNLRKNLFYKYGVVLNKNEAYFTYELLDRSIISRVTLSESGVSQPLTWVDRTQRWEVDIIHPTEICDIYRLCGAYGSCNIAKSPVCGCLDRFLPKDPEGWKRADWSSGCVRRTSLNCKNGDVFLKYSGIKLPDTQYSLFNQSMTLEECKVLCLKNCSCTAYTDLDISKGGSGCLLWFEDLANIKLVPEEQYIYIRMASSELELKRKKREILVLSLSLSMGMVLLGLSLMLYLRKRKKSNHRLREGDPMGSALFDWPKRFQIINGIARGLMYLHQDSRLRIIHRDLKASNILLDSDMNPKISDFGMARSFGGNETGANTSYMSPEYAVDGIFSVKSDVFSFGVLLLEIVSGKRNRGFSHRDHHHNLLGHVNVHKHDYQFDA
ncbi:G-type lectin S-receptor-like serine/threonine-protein kinase [Forsythia ovata]|uniref:non-specific serine/threonine protein kinase n=1 Tax=Forsythia ovata TaxID=205694 RepID=A0ABD1X3E5_9LAMI